MNLKLKIWRQKNAQAKGEFVEYAVENISPDTSFLEMLDILNNDLIHKGEEPIVFDHDCREGICGMCSLHINGHATRMLPRASCTCVSSTTVKLS